MTGLQPLEIGTDAQPFEMDPVRRQADQRTQSLQKVNRKQGGDVLVQNDKLDNPHVTTARSTQNDRKQHYL